MARISYLLDSIDLIAPGEERIVAASVSRSFVADSYQVFVTDLSGIAQPRDGLYLSWLLAMASSGTTRWSVDFSQIVGNPPVGVPTSFFQEFIVGLGRYDTNAGDQIQAMVTNQGSLSLRFGMYVYGNTLAPQLSVYLPLDFFGQGRPYEDGLGFRWW